MPRLAHVAATFAIVLMAYWAYAVVAVPLIEPAAEPIARRVGPDPRPSESAKTLRRWEALFPPGAWELKDPKVLTMDQVQLVFQEYQNLGHGRVRISIPLRSSSPPTTPKRPPTRKPAPSSSKRPTVRCAALTGRSIRRSSRWGSS